MKCETCGKPAFMVATVGLDLAPDAKLVVWCPMHALEWMMDCIQEVAKLAPDP